MLSTLLLLWRSSRGYRLRPWASPYLRWRIETYSGIPADTLSPRKFWEFLFTRRASMLRYLAWAARMQHAGRSRH